VVRGSAAVLIGPLAALAYFVGARWLPSEPPEAISDALGALFVAIAVLTVLPIAQGGVLVLVLVGLGTGMLTAAFDAAGARAAASLPEALMWATAGLVFARTFDTPALALAVPLLVAGLDAAGVIGTAGLLNDPAHAGDPLTLEIPRWGGGQAAQLAGLDAAVLAGLGQWTADHHLRRDATELSLAAALAVAVAVELPAVALLGGVFLAVNGRRLLGLFRGAPEG
jgi:hypothetical protein